MYTPKIHNLNMKWYWREKLEYEEFELLAAAFTPEEQYDLGLLAVELHATATLDDMLELAEVGKNEFVEFACLSSEEVERFSSNNFSAFERAQIAYMLCMYVYHKDRLNWCQVCLRPYYKAGDIHMLCDKCMGEINKLRPNQKNF